MRRARRVSQRRRIRRRPRGGNPRSRRTKPSTSLGTTLVSAARSLIGLIPGGEALKAIADFGFKAITTTTRSHECLELGGLSYQGLNVYALGTCIYPNIAACIRDCPLLTRMIAEKKLDTNFLDGRIRSFTVTVEPTNIISKRSGNWALLFTPYRDAKDHAKYLGEMDKSTPQIPMLMRHPGVVADRADRSLTLTFQPRVEDGYIGLYVPITAPFGMICVAYQEENRDSWGAFTAEEFSCRVRVSGSIVLRSATLASGREMVTTEFTDSTPVQSKTVAVTDCFGVTKDYSYSDLKDLGSHIEVAGLRTISAMDH